jgi:hypothetical protein
MRYADWRQHLVAYLADAARRPFAQGTHDCALFLAGGVLAMTGQDYAARYRGRYTTTRGGLRILRKDGFETHVALAAHYLPDLPVALAREGDAAVVPTGDGPALGIVQGEGIYVLGPGGMGVVPLTTAFRAFEV